MNLVTTLTPSFEFSALVLAIAALLDYAIGDPWNWLHPVQVMGWVIQRYTHLTFKTVTSPLGQRWAGIGLAGLLIGGSAVLSAGLLAWAGRWHVLVRLPLETVMLASCFAGRSLRHAAEAVLKPLALGDLPRARQTLSLYVGRDTDALTEPEVLRAVMETVTENATDGVIAPLFWAIAGSFLGIGPVPLAIAYKAASTLDSTVGYKEAPYTDLGWFSARFEDGLTWLPCRLTVFTLGLLSGRPVYVWRICRRDAPQDPSPNAGWSECVYAAILGVQVGGVNVYRGQIKRKPLLGDALHPITPARIHQAMRLTRWVVLLWLAIAIGGLGLLSRV